MFCFCKKLSGEMQNTGQVVASSGKVFGLLELLILRKAVATLLWLSLATFISGAEFGFLQHYNRSQVSQARQHRGAAYVPQYQPYIPTSDVESHEHYQSSISRKDLDFEYRPVCQVVRETVELRNTFYDYHPPLYHKVLCLSALPVQDDSSNLCNPGIVCNQVTSKLYVSRSSWGSDYWEQETIDIPSNCECLWPRS